MFGVCMYVLYVRIYVLFIIVVAHAHDTVKAHTYTILVLLCMSF